VAGGKQNVSPPPPPVCEGSGPALCDVSQKFGQNRHFGFFERRGFYKFAPFGGQHPKVLRRIVRHSTPRVYFTIQKALPPTPMRRFGHYQYLRWRAKLECRRTAYASPRRPALRFRARSMLRISGARQSRVNAVKPGTDRDTGRKFVPHGALPKEVELYENESKAFVSRCLEANRKQPEEIAGTVASSASQECFL